MRDTTLIRGSAAVYLLLHAIVHAVGFLSAWRLSDFQDAPYTTLVLNGTLDVGDTGMRIVGLLWLVGAAAFVVAAIATWRGRTSAIRVVAAAALVSIVICIVGLPAAAIGLGIDVALLAVLTMLEVVRAAATRPAVSGA